MLDVWEFERGGSDVSGIPLAAKALMSRIKEIDEDETWGAEEIRRAASGDIERLKTRNAWNAVRVNIHITKQLELSLQGINDEEDLDDEV
jgi:Beta protein